MIQRLFASIGAVSAVIAVLLQPPVQVAAQRPSTVAKTNANTKTWTPPRTPDGQPDLQGFWTNGSSTPLERPDNLAGKPFYETLEEAAEIQHRAVESDLLEQTVSGTEANVHYDHSQFALKTGQLLVPNLRTSLIVDPPDGKVPPLTPEGKKREADRAEARRRMGGRYDAAQNFGLAARCIIWGGGPPMLPQGYNSNYQIVQAPGYVMILVEMIGDVRIIPLDGRPPLPQSVHQWKGNSRGHWEGNTLVVETTNFNDKTAFRGSGENLRLIELFTRTDDETILYKFTAEDPSTWTKPWSAEIPMKKTTGPLFEYACHEGNYGLYNTLSGARAEEKRAAEKAANKGSK